MYQGVSIHAITAYTDSVSIHTITAYTDWVSIHAITTYTDWVSIHAITTYTDWALFFCTGIVVRWLGDLPAHNRVGWPGSWANHPPPWVSGVKTDHPLHINNVACPYKW